MTLTLDTKHSASLTADSRSSAGSLSLDSKVTGAYLWASTTLPWALQAPWSLNGTGLVLTKDIRN